MTDFWDNTDRARCWIQTHSGLKFDLTNPTTDMIDIYDIIWALSQINRFTGHTIYPYSVCQHSVYVSRILGDMGFGKESQLWGLLHDATEAYVSDLASPIKKMVRDYRELEHSVQEVIMKKFGLPNPPPEVIKADLIMLAKEKEEVMGPAPEPWNGLPDYPKDWKIIEWIPGYARAAFLDRYIYLSPIRGQGDRRYLDVDWS